MRPYWQEEDDQSLAQWWKTDSVGWDLLGVGSGLILAWLYEWKVLDLIWSLWLSSLVVGYVVIMVQLLISIREQEIAPRTGILALAFFTLHFCLAHILYAFFLNGYFPQTAVGESLDWPTFTDIFSSYWIFIPAVAISERGLFNSNATRMPTSLISQIADAGSGIIEPYQNVLRLHVLIVIFALLHFIKLESYSVYAGVYAINFFPWKRVFGRQT